MILARLAVALAAPLLLAGCLLAPGRFTSNLDIRADKTFSFAYAGEVVAYDPGGAVTHGMQGMASAMASGMSGAIGADEGQKPAMKTTTAAPAGPPVESAAERAKGEAVAVALLREEGFRSVRYLGNDKYAGDYALSGRLDRSFVFPFNSDAGAIVPWLAVEVRKDGTVRVKAAAFGDESSAMSGSPSCGPERFTRGAFTLSTDASLVMHNNEGGASGGKVVWQVTPTSKTVPTAVVRF